MEEISRAMKTTSSSTAPVSRHMPTAPKTISA
jgi:hypothetical protein